MMQTCIVLFGWDFNIMSLRSSGIQLLQRPAAIRGNKEGKSIAKNRFPLTWRVEHALRFLVTAFWCRAFIAFWTFFLRSRRDFNFVLRLRGMWGLGFLIKYALIQLVRVRRDCQSFNIESIVMLCFSRKPAVNFTEPDGKDLELPIYQYDPFLPNIKCICVTNQ